MKFKHTPGPWEASRPKGSNGWWNINDPLEDPMLFLATVYNNEENNARLIAAAPDLLNALIDAIEVLLDNDIDFIRGVDVIERATGMKIEEIMEGGNDEISCS